jgi:hypothetical protein
MRRFRSVPNFRRTFGTLYFDAEALMQFLIYIIRIYLRSTLLLYASLLHSTYLNDGGGTLSTGSPALFTIVGKEYLQLESCNRDVGNGNITLAF